MAPLERRLYLLMTAIIGSTILLGLFLEGPRECADGLVRILIGPARLVNDFTVTGGEGASLANASLVALAGMLIVYFSKVRFSGPTVAAVLTMMGFGLFGKTPLNIAPVILGVACAARLLRKSFKEYILIALFGTALGPISSAVAVEAGLTGAWAVAAGAGAGIAMGLLLPAAAISMLRLHQGFNLYNIGLTSGFLAIFAASLLRAGGFDLASRVVWNSNPSLALVLYPAVLSAALLAAGLLMGGRKAFKDLKRIQKLSGRLPSDFMDIVSPGGALLNMGLLGLASWGYVMAVRGDLSGPTMGGILTIIGFASFGKNLRNTWPVALGVVAATLLFGKGLASPGPLLAFLFSTTLAPLAGQFGVTAGFLAGFVHLTMVERTGEWHGGINLYNNGFAGGLTATLFVSIIEWFKANRPGGEKVTDNAAHKEAGR